MVTTFQGREGEHSGKRLPLASEWKLGKGGYPRDSLREFGRSVPGHVGVEREGDATSPWGVAYLWRFTVRLWINLWISLEPAPVPPIPSPPPMLGLQLIGDAFTSSRLR